MTNGRVDLTVDLRVAVTAALVSLAMGCGDPRGEVGDDDAFEAVSALAPGGPAARPLAPLSGSIAGSARPTLRWEGPDRVVIQICADQACHHPRSAFVATGHAARPPRPLPPGVAYWRIVSSGSHPVSSSSPVWELFISAGHGGAPDANRGLRYDADADGFADGIVRDQNGNTAIDVLHIFAGGPHGLRPQRDTTLPLDTTFFGVGTTAAGDVNGDGFGDAAVADGRGIVVYPGSPAGPRSTPLVVIPTPPGVNGFDFGTQLTGLGDVNGDGYGDLAAADLFKRVWVFLGGPAGPGTVPNWVLDRTAVIDRDVRLMTAGDLNGDGFGDLVVIDYGPDGTPQGFRFFRGGPGGLEDPAAGTFVERPAFPNGIAGDVDGDGVVDLVTSEVTALALFRGGAGFPAAPVQTIPVADRPIPLQLGDFDGDGDADLAAHVAVATAPDPELFIFDDRIDVYRAGPAGLATAPTQTIRETDVLPDNRLNFGIRIGNADFDGDGREDLLVGAPAPSPLHFDIDAAAAFVFRGTRAGLSVRPAPRLDGTIGFGAGVSAGVPQSQP